MTPDSSGTVSIITIDNPQRRNAIDDPTRRDLLRLLREAMNDDDTRSVVIHGAEQTFCAGGDLSGMPTHRPHIEARLGEMHDIVRQIVYGSRPVIAAVEGSAFGSGMSIASACDVVVAARDSRFGCSFGRVKLIPDAGFMWSVPRRVGVGRTRQIVLRGEVLDAQEAHVSGFVDVLCEPGSALEAAVNRAKLLELDARTIGAAKELIAAMADPSLDAILAAELELQIVLLASPDFQIARQTFLNRRAPSNKLNTNHPAEAEF